MQTAGCLEMNGRLRRRLELLPRINKVFMARLLPLLQVPRAGQKTVPNGEETGKSSDLLGNRALLMSCWACELIGLA